ncbi:MAG: hypothetical protein JWO36_4148 [Myxococcales bacterium]|nr:hypothetical protein [Myxococcales bacterium]
MVAACGRDVPRPDAFVFCTDQHPLAPTFTNVQALFGACTSCHTANANLLLGPGVSYGNLVGKMAPNYTDPPTDESCGGILVQPGAPEASYLYLKVSLDAPCAGSRMPVTDIGIPSPLIPCEQALIHDWIAAGAPND